jgi:Spy/CpxP family protein refolding chaperone
MFQFAGKFGRHGCGRPGGREGFGGFGLEELLQDIDLTDEQVERLAELKGEGMGEGAQFMAQGGRHFKQIMQEILKENIDKDKVKEAHKALQEHRAKVGEKMLERALSIAETLTPQQRKQVKNRVQRRFLGLDGHDDRHGPGFGFSRSPGGPERRPT